MVGWQRHEDGRSWDETLGSMPDANIFQSSAWAEHKSDFGWSPVRLIGREGGAPRAMVQVLVRRLPLGGALCWARGGPMGEPACWDGGLLRALGSAVGRPWLYLRVCSYRPAAPGAEAALRGSGWKRPAAPLNRASTMLLDLSEDGTARRGKLSSNWAHNLRRGEKRCRSLRVWEDPDSRELAGLYRAMESYKGIAPQHGEAELRSLLSRLGPRLLILRADGDDGRPIALRACAMSGEKAWDLLAANAPEARKKYASFALLWALLEECRKRGIRSYDLGGVDPEKARGVYDFKRGTGAAFADLLGEWDWARPSLLRPLADRAIAASGKAGG